MKRSPLKREGSKHRERRLSYERKKKVYLQEHPGCQFEFRDGFDNKIGIMCNSKRMISIHHMMGRGKYLDDERFFLTLCQEHHDWVEANKREARRLRYILYI